MQLTVAQLAIFPVKSLAGIYLSENLAQPSGFLHDRSFMLCHPDGTFITARQYPQLLKLQPTLQATGISISAPQQPPISVNYVDFSRSPQLTEVWGSYFDSYIASIAVNRWFSDYLQQEVQLRWIGESPLRRVKRFPDTELSFADGYPYLLINRASFDYLQARCPQMLDIKQFRGNIIVDGALPFAEDGWQTIRIGEVEFELVKPCSRCILTTINIHSAQSNAAQEPLTTLRQFRTDAQGEIDFGINMLAKNSGTIQIGDPIEILKNQPAKQYHDLAPLPPIKSSATPAQSVQIRYQEQQFTGNNQQTLLEQLEQHGIAIPYSCRAGICGRCQITLQAGEVEPLTHTAIKADKRQILACSCRPKSDMILK